MVRYWGETEEGNFQVFPYYILCKSSMLFLKETSYKEHLTSHSTAGSWKLREWELLKVTEQDGTHSFPLQHDSMTILKVKVSKVNYT